MGREGSGEGRKTKKIEKQEEGPSSSNQFQGILGVLVKKVQTGLTSHL